MRYRPRVLAGSTGRPHHDSLRPKMSWCLSEQFMASFIEDALCCLESGMSMSSWIPSIVVDNVGGLGRVWRRAEVERTGLATPRSIAGLDLTRGVQRKKPAATGAKPPFPRFVEPEQNASELMERAEIVAKQMRYFGLVARKSSFSELLPSAKRAGFALLNDDAERKEAGFQWATGEPDFIFSVSFEHPDRVSIIAESRGDIFGLVLVSSSHVPNISVETKPWLANHELGGNALRFRDLLLKLPDFDGMAAWTKY
jgi:hypothetical protein